MKSERQLRENAPILVGRDLHFDSGDFTLTATPQHEDFITFSHFIFHLRYIFRIYHALVHL